MIVRIVMVTAALFVLWSAVQGTAMAQTAEPPAPSGGQERPAQAAGPGAPRSMANRFRLQVDVYRGAGLDLATVGVTNNGDEVRISSGGGWGLGATLGYGLTQQVDIEGAFGVQASGLQPPGKHAGGFLGQSLMLVAGGPPPSVENAEGFFGRSFLLATAKYRVPIRENLQWKFGIGAGYYLAGRLDVTVDASHAVIDYRDSAGAHATGEIEILVRERLSLSAGLKYYRVTYGAGRAMVNGVAVPVSSLPGEYRSLTGDGVDVTVGLAVLF